MYYNFSQEEECYDIIVARGYFGQSFFHMLAYCKQQYLLQQQVETRKAHMYAWNIHEIALKS